MKTIQDLIQEGKKIEGVEAVLFHDSECFVQWQCQNLIDEVKVLGLSKKYEGFIRCQVKKSGQVFHFNPDHLEVK